MHDQFIASIAAATRLELGKLRLLVPIRLALAIVIPLIIGELVGHITLGVAAAIGAFICGVADTGDAFPVRARVMLITAAALTLTAVIGGSVSENIVATVALSAVVAGLCGYATVFGPNAGLTGMLALVVYNLFAGGPVGEDTALAQGAAVLAGSLLQTAFALSGWPFRRFAGVRGEIADAWRCIAVLSSGKPKDMLSPTLPGQLVLAAAGVGWSGAFGQTREWLQAMVAPAESIRLPLAAVAARRKELEELGELTGEYADLTAFSGSVSRFARAVARALVLPFRRRGIPAAHAEVLATAEAARQWAPKQVAAITSALADAAGLLSQPPPIGRRGEMVFRIEASRLPWGAALRGDLHRSSPILRHAIRLAVVMPIAWLVGLAVLTDHQYWVPLTVAWVTRPGYGLTVGRVVSRTCGTLVGLGLIGVVFFLFEPGVAAMIVICGICGYLLFAALPVNYTTAVVFVTGLIVTLLALDGNQLVNSMANRAVGTILGGLLAIIASQVGAVFASPTLADRLEAVTQATRRYAAAVFSTGENVRESALSLINARMAAASAVEEAKMEPRRGVLDPFRAEKVLDALLMGIFAVAAVSAGSSGRDEVGDSALDAEIDGAKLDQELARLAQRLTLVASGADEVDLAQMAAVPTVEPAVTPGQDRACAAVERALAYL